VLVGVQLAGEAGAVVGAVLGTFSKLVSERLSSELKVPDIVSSATV
jgi:hypothetical protein